MLNRLIVILSTECRIPLQPRIRYPQISVKRAEIRSKPRANEGPRGRGVEVGYGTELCECATIKMDFRNSGHLFLSFSCR